MCIPENKITRSWKNIRNLVLHSFVHKPYRSMTMIITSTIKGNLMGVTRELHENNLQIVYVLLITLTFI